MARNSVIILLAALALAQGCGPRELILEGERIGLRELDAPLDAAAQEGEAANRAVPVALPAAQRNAEWTHRNGTPAHRLRHPALSPAPQLAWSADIGAGNDRRSRITADPVVAGGRVFTLDADGAASAVSTAGQVLWRRSLAAAGEREGGLSGGGLAFGAGRLFVSTGHGRVLALDPETGAELWTQDIAARAAGAPTVADGLVLVSATDGRGWALRAENGRIAWQVSATGSTTNLLSGASPAAGAAQAFFPFPSGEVFAVALNSGAPQWKSVAAGRRLGQVYATISGISGDPVIDGARVYVGNQSGRVVALNATTGERLWTAAEGAYSPVWPEGGAIFLVSDLGELVRLDAATGERVWGVQLPYFQSKRPRRFKAVYAHFGPVLAGGRLWVASGDEKLRAFDPVDGSLVLEAEMPGGAAANPAVADGTLYVVTEGGKLLAFR